MQVWIWIWPLLSVALHAPKRHVEILTVLVLMNGTFGNRDFTDVIKLKWGHSGVGVALM